MTCMDISVQVTSDVETDDDDLHHDNDPHCEKILGIVYAWTDSQGMETDAAWTWEAMGIGGA